MSEKNDNPYQALSRIFHEPNRLAIMSTLCATADGLSFHTLKEECNLTDGNLSRHLKTLEESAMIRLEKSFIGSKPRTTVWLTDHGRSHFFNYLVALEEVLNMAAEAMGGEAENLTIKAHLTKPLSV